MSSVSSDRRMLSPSPPAAVEKDSNANTITGLAIAGGLVVASAAFLFSRYKISKPEQYLVRTGLGIKDMSISRTAIVWPFQDCMCFCYLFGF